MRTSHKIGIGVLVGIFFAAGYATRVHCNYRDQVAAARRDSQSALQGTRIASTRLTDVADVDIRPVETLYSVVKSLREHYVEQLTIEDEGKMTYDAMKSMLASLNDPKTRFLEPSTRKLVAEAAQGRFHGIGAILAINQTWKPNTAKPSEPISYEHLMVVSLLPNGPAAKSGLKPGDEIVAINGNAVLPFNPFQRVTDMMKEDKYRNMERTELRKVLEAEQNRIDDGISITDAETQLMSQDGKNVELTIAAKAPAKETKIKIQPAETAVDAVDPVRVEDGDYGYVHVNYFGNGTGDRFAEAVKGLESKGVKGLVLDLRDSTGGDMRSVEQVAKWFAPDKAMAVLVKSRGRKSTLKIPALAGGQAWKKPVVVLVDGSTSRAPEVLASALKDNGVAKLVGQKTYGDFADTTLIDLADGSAVTMTTGKYVSTKGQDFNGKGLPVDVPVVSEDQQLKEAVKVLDTAAGRS